MNEHSNNVWRAGTTTQEVGFGVSDTAEEMDLTVIAETFRLLGDPTRLRILLACLDKPLAVSEIAVRVDASQSLVSHHLRLLRAARLVKGMRQARQVFYEAADQHVRHMLADIIEHAAEDDEHH